MLFTDWKPVRLPGNLPAAENTADEDAHTPEYGRAGSRYTFACRKYYNVGRWIGWLKPAGPDAQYRITMTCGMYGKSAMLLANVFGTDAEDHGLTMDYLQPQPDGTLTYTYRPAEDVRGLKLEVTFRCFGEGGAWFSEPEVEMLPADAPSDTADSIIVGTTWLKPPPGGYSHVGESLPALEAIIDRAAADPKKPDILLFTETTLDRHVNLPLAQKGVPEDCEGMHRIRARAREHGMHLIFSIHEQTENGLYNTAYVIGDDGEIVGKYRKVQITYSELSAGMIPGEDIHCIDTRFGRIGIVTCWDAWFPETARELYKQGAKILFHPSAGKPMCMWQSRARENGLPFVSAYAGEPEFCCIISSRGEEIAHITDADAGYVTAEIPLGRETYSFWLGLGPEQSRRGACERNVKLPEIRNELYR